MGGLTPRSLGGLLPPSEMGSSPTKGVAALPRPRGWIGSRPHESPSRVSRRDSQNTMVISEEPNQPLDQALADDHLGDDVFLILDQRRGGIVRLGAGFGRLVYQADFRQVPLQGLLGERLLPRDWRVALSGGRGRQFPGLPEPDQGITDDIVFVGVFAGSYCLFY